MEKKYIWDSKAFDWLDSNLRINIKDRRNGTAKKTYCIGKIITNTLLKIIKIRSVK